MYCSNLLRISLLFFVSIILLNFNSLALGNPSVLLSYKPSSVPNTPPPNNKTQPGGGLSFSKTSCNNSHKSLTALVPPQNPVLTTSAHPVVLLYVPDSSKDILFGEFWINSQDEKTRIYQKVRFKFPDTPGIISVSLPKLPESSLETGKYYHWYFNIYCNDDTPEEADLDVNGWVKRIASTPEGDNQIKAGSPEIWYDAIAYVYESLRLSPQDSQLQQKWVNLFNFIDEQDLAKESITKAVISSEK